MPPLRQSSSAAQRGLRPDILARQLALPGLGRHPGRPAWARLQAHINLKPAVVGDVTWVKAHHDGAYGRIVSNWRREGDKLRLDVTVPANSTAAVCVPTADADHVTESAAPAARAEGVKFLRMEDGRAVFEVGAGVYHFESRLPATQRP